MQYPTTHQILKKAREEMRTLNDIKSINLTGNLAKFHSPNKNSEVIGDLFIDVNSQIKLLDNVLGVKVVEYQGQLVGSYKNKLSNLRHSTKQLSTVYSNNLDLREVYKEISTKGAERDFLRNNCNQLDCFIHDTHDEILRVKAEKEEATREQAFVIEQIAFAKDNKAKMETKIWELEK